MISVKPLREEAIKVGYEATKDRLPIPFEAWQKALDSWNVQALPRRKAAASLKLS